MLTALLAGLTPIRSRDYFWHLATGRWILDNGRLPATDPFSVGADQIPWINGAWLFQVGAALVQQLGDHALVSFSLAIALAVTFGWICTEAQQRVTPGAAAFLAALGLWGAWHRLDARPETAGIICAVAAVILFQRKPRLLPLYYLLLAALWVNLHPSAVLAPVIAAAAVVDAVLARSDRRAAVLSLAASCAGLMLNPWGWRGVLAPFSLASQVESGTFVNLEWLPSRPADFPLLFLCVAAVVALVAVDRARHPFESILLIALAFLAVRWVRNHGFFFTLFPLLTSVLIRPAWLRAGRSASIANIAAAAALLGALSPLLVRGISPGYDRERFPARSGALIERLDLSGNIYTADQFGGYLIWSVYPERRVLIDGRNELYTRLIPRILEARRDGRDWQRLFEELHLTIAVEEHAQVPLEVVDGATGRRVMRSPSLTYFPRERWALIAVDPASMLFVRRDSAPQGVLERLEYREWRPDIVDPAAEIRDPRLWEMESVRGEAELRSVPLS